MSRPRFDAETTLAAYWSERENDVMYHYPSSKTDGHWLYGWWDYARMSSGTKSFLEELAERGYDITTLRFTVKKKADHPRWKPPEKKAGEP